MRPPRSRHRPLSPKPHSSHAYAAGAGVHVDAPPGPDLYSAIFEQDRAVHLLIDSVTGAIVDANPAACAFYGYTRDALQAMRHTDVSFRTSEQIAEDMARAKLGQGGVIVSRHRLANGEARDVEITLTSLQMEGRAFLHALVMDVTARTRAETALCEKEAQLRLALEGANLATWDWNIQTGRVIRSERWAEMLGYAAEEVDPQFDLWEQLVHPDDLPVVRQRLAAHLAGQTPRFANEYRMRHKAGHWAWILGSGRVIERDADGRPLRACGTMLDITERHEAEAALRVREAQLANAMEIAHLGYWEYDVAGDTFTFDDHFYAIFNTTPEKMGGYTMSSAEYAERFVYPDDRKVVGEEIAQSLASTEPHYSRQLEHRVIFADGGIGYIAVRFFVVKDAQGRTVKTVGANQDISERKQAELELQSAVAELAEREATLRGLIAQSMDGIVLTDDIGTIIEWNAAMESITGLRSDEVVGRLTWDVQFQLLPAEFRTTLAYERFVAAMLKYYKTLDAEWQGKPRSAPVQRPDGTRRIVQSVYFPVLGPRGALFAAITRDVTELRREEDTLVQRQKLESIGLLAGGMAHDFNNIHQAVLAQAELALRKLGPDQPAARHVQKIIGPVQRAAGLTRQLAAYAGLEKYFAQPEELAQIVRDSEDLARTALPENAALRFGLPAGLPPVWVDRGQVQQVLMNLLLNAGEAIGEQPGIVTISIGRQTVAAGDEASYAAGAVPSPGAYLYLRVADTGAGMDAHTLARACEPFFTTRFTGRGLGLPAVLGIVRSHAGGLSLQSLPGAGTVVTVLWPVMKAE